MQTVETCQDHKIDCLEEIGFTKSLAERQGAYGTRAFNGKERVRVIFSEVSDGKDVFLERDWDLI